MARTRKSDPRVAPLENYLNGVAKSLVERLYGPQGLPWGTRLTELEDTVLAIRQYLSEQLLNQALQRQADNSAERPKDYRDCPSCGGAVETTHPPTPDTGTAAGAGQPPPEPRGLDTQGGTAAWHEPECYCHSCRRSFFPSVQESRPGADGHGQPGPRS
jgi:hypothetical protein